MTSFTSVSEKVPSNKLGQVHKIYLRGHEMTAKNSFSATHHFSCFSTFVAISFWNIRKFFSISKYFKSVRVMRRRSRGVLNQVSQKRSTSRMTQVSRMCVSLWSQFDIVANSFLPVPCRYRGVEPGVRRDPSPAHHRRHHHRAGSLPPLWTPGGAHRPPHCPLKSHSAPPAGPCAPLHLNVTHSKDTLISLQNTSTL